VPSQFYCGGWVPGSLAALAPRNDSYSIAEPVSIRTGW
jgi:hypothetical protein